MIGPDAAQLAAHAGVSLEEDRAAVVAETFVALIQPDLDLVAAVDLSLSEAPATTYTVVPSAPTGTIRGHPQPPSEAGA